MELQINQQFAEANTQFQIGAAIALVAPPLDEDYWLFRVTLSPSQAVVGFPKFTTIGIGFQVEADDWNTNLPYTSPAERIAQHIACNKGDDAIADADVVAAIQLIQAAAAQLMGAKDN
jgi:hypothetical protein